MKLVVSLAVMAFLAVSCGTLPELGTAANVEDESNEVVTGESSPQGGISEEKRREGFSSKVIVGGVAVGAGVVCGLIPSCRRVVVRGYDNIKNGFKDKVWSKVKNKFKRSTKSADETAEVVEETTKAAE